MAERIKGSIYFKLFAVFFRVGFFTIGGGYAMLPMLRKEVVEKIILSVFLIWDRVGQ